MLPLKLKRKKKWKGKNTHLVKASKRIFSPLFDLLKLLEIQIFTPDVPVVPVKFSSIQNEQLLRLGESPLEEDTGILPVVFSPPLPQFPTKLKRAQDE